MKTIETIKIEGLEAELHDDGSVDLRKHVGHQTFLRMHIGDVLMLADLSNQVQDAWAKHLYEEGAERRSDTKEEA